MDRNAKLIKEFTEVADLAAAIQQRCYRAIQELGQFSAPAPRGTRKQKAISTAQASELITSFRKSLIKKAV